MAVPTEVVVALIDLVEGMAKLGGIQQKTIEDLQERVAALGADK